MLDDTVHGKDNLEEKTREDADNRMYYLRLNMFNKDVICCCDGGGTGRITWRRRTGRLLTLGYVTLVEFFFN